MEKRSLGIAFELVWSMRRLLFRRCVFGIRLAWIDGNRLVGCWIVPYLGQLFFVDADRWAYCCGCTVSNFCIRISCCRQSFSFRTEANVDKIDLNTCFIVRYGLSTFAAWYWFGRQLMTSGLNLLIVRMTVVRIRLQLTAGQPNQSGRKCAEPFLSANKLQFRFQRGGRVGTGQAEHLLVIVGQLMLQLTFRPIHAESILQQWLDTAVEKTRDQNVFETRRKMSQWLAMKDGRVGGGEGRSFT